ncbi:Aldehyde dehydrogenase [Lunasporangiospora selenospora]|uniref:Aldehyde dehydrogenase n=1 Tax=Lunasporangiospora selenospora TaxID=979761 RepID=A0A9P6G089_9FUNG|nr:Aldehyde dehydrogenase [Lunasporangiospora selenospora]
MVSLAFTPLKEIPKVVQDLHDTFQSGITRPLEYRKEQLKGLHNLVQENEEAFREAAFLDSHKPPTEYMISETGTIRQECIDAIKNLDKWAAKKPIKTGLINSLDNVYTRMEPLGTVLIIGAWNYALNLLLAPAVGAIAAGNTVLLKPSEVATHTAALVTKLLPVYVDRRSIHIVNGGVAETTVLLEQKFDHIFYTGSGNVGKVIMSAAAKHLTPVTLELGGKSPAFVSADVDVNVAARRLAIAKFFNCGQSCIAPDYLIVQRGIEEELVNRMRAHIQEFYGASVQTSDSYARIVNRNHFQRLQKMLEATKGKVVVGGETQESDLFITPTLVLNVQPGDSLLDSEIFGPILPIMVVDDLKEGVAYVNKGDQPLALYVYSRNFKLADEIVDNTRSGTVVVNDSMVQFVIPDLPFGGTGPSGMGSYHGQKSFDTFSHARSTVVKGLGMDQFNNIRYPPYTEKKMSWLEWIMFSKAKYGPNKENPGAEDAKAKL